MNIQIRKIWYNSAESAFEGRVDIRRNGCDFRYPCSVEGPMDMAPDDVMARMRQQAAQMSDSALAQ